MRRNKTKIQRNTHGKNTRPGLPWSEYGGHLTLTNETFTLILQLIIKNFAKALNKIVLLQKLILVNSSSKISVHSDLINLAKQNDEKAVDLMLKWAYTGHEKNYTTERVARKIIMSRTLSQTLAVDFMACNNYQIDEEHIKKIRVPTLIISSENDKMIPSSLSSELQKIIENSEIKTMENTGHMAILEEFSKVGDLIGSFLSKT